MRFLDRVAWASIPVFPSAEGGEFFSHDQLRRMTVDALKDFIRRRIGGYTVAIKNSPTNNRLYRGRICGERPRTIDDGVVSQAS